MSVKEFDRMTREHKLAYVLFFAGTYGVTASVDAVRAWLARHGWKNPLDPVEVAFRARQLALDV